MAAPPPALRRVRGATTLTIALAVAGALVLVGWVLAHPAGDSALPWTRTPLSQASTDPDAYAAQLRAAVDEQRRHADMAPLADATCARAAAEQRADLLIGQRLEHAPLDDVRRSCPQAAVVRENLSRAAARPVAVVTTWMASTRQRADILDRTITGTAVACTHDGDQMLCVQLLLGGS